jgi:hypothetical protein
MPYERNKKVNIHIPHRLVDEFLLGWAEQRRMLANEEITKEQYVEWKLNWPRSTVPTEKEEGQDSRA